LSKATGKYLKQIWIFLATVAFLLSSCSQQVASVLVPTPAPTLEIEDSDDYLMILLEKTDQMAQGILLMQSILSAEEANPEVQADLRTGINAVLESHSEILEMKTPSHLRDLHRLVLNASADCKESAHVLAEALEQESENYQMVMPLLANCEQGYGILVYALEAALEEHW
jgi:hypothetical protein